MVSELRTRAGKGVTTAGSMLSVSLRRRFCGVSRLLFAAKAAVALDTERLGVMA
jgi:hypothetical protein